MKKIKVYNTDGIIFYKGSQKTVPKKIVDYEDYKKLLTKKEKNVIIK